MIEIKEEIFFCIIIKINSLNDPMKLPDIMGHKF